MKRLLIIGAGDCGREMLCWIKRLNSTEWKIGGFLDDNPNALYGYNCSHKIIGEICTYVPQENDLLVCSITSPRIRNKICTNLLSKGAQFITLIHPNAFILDDTKIGIGCVICPNVCISIGTSIEDFVYLNVSSVIGHDCIIGKGSVVNAGSCITGKVKMSEGVFVGTHATIIPGVQVGEYATIGAGSVVIKNVDSNVTVMGVPAKQIPQFNKVTI